MSVTSLTTPLQLSVNIFEWTAYFTTSNQFCSRKIKPCPLFSSFYILLLSEICHNTEAKTVANFRFTQTFKAASITTNSCRNVCRVARRGVTNENDMCSKTSLKYQTCLISSDWMELLSVTKRIRVWHHHTLHSFLWNLSTQICRLPSRQWRLLIFQRGEAHFRPTS